MRQSLLRQRENLDTVRERMEVNVYLSPGYNGVNSACGKCRRVSARVAGGPFPRCLPLGIRVLYVGGYLLTRPPTLGS